MAGRRENNFFFLLVGLLIILVLAPMGLGRIDGIISLAYTGTLIVGVWSLARIRGVYIAGWILAVASFALAFAELRFDSPALLLGSAGIAFLFCSLSLWIAGREVVFGDRVDGNRIAGAVCVYLLIGLNWAFVYNFLVFAVSDSFSNLPVDPAARFLGLVYYSFVTLTTLGYGDITPLSPLARALAYLEAVTGVMYVAILVASLISSFRSKRP